MAEREELRIASSFMVAREEDKTDSEGHRAWTILSKRRDGYLGNVGWYAPWKQHVFVPAGNTVFSFDCLYALHEFVNNAITEHSEWEKGKNP